MDDKLKKINIAVVIPARGGSKRLKNKNIYQVLGKPMINWVIDECMKSKYIKDIYVSTESNQIAKVIKNKKVKLIQRPESLSKDHVEKMDAISHAVKEIIKNSDFKNPEIVISLQANSPTLTIKDLDNALEFFYSKLYVHQPICEVISVGEDNLQNACFRIMTRKTVFQKTLSTHVGIFMTNCHDVHNIDDVRIVESQLKERYNDKM
jgi:CMP-N-acetylneuraminic acid synthetase